MKAVRPFCIKYGDAYYKLQWDTLGFFEHAFMSHLSADCFVLTQTVLPPFLPNEYLLKTHADKGKSEWEIYAWAVRDAMCKAGNFKKIQADSRDKQLYKDFMTGKTDEIVANGKTFTAPPMRKKKVTKTE